MHRLPAPAPASSKRRLPTANTDISAPARKKVSKAGELPTQAKASSQAPEDLIPAPASTGHPRSRPDLDMDLDGFTLIEGKRQKRRGRRARPHPALLVSQVSSGPPSPPDAVATVLFYPANSSDSLAKVSRMSLARSFESLDPRPVSVRSIRRGGLAIDFASPAKLDRVFAVSELAGIAVTARHPTRPESCQGTIRGDFSDADEVKELYVMHASNPLLLSVRRLGSAQLWVLHFSSPSLPPSVRVFYNTHRVSPFFRHPTQCYRCRRFGHVAALCRGAAHCVTCGATDHLKDACKAPSPWCVNCGEDHPSSHKQCSHRVFALQVEKEIARGQVCRQTARREIAARFASTVAPSRSFAAVVEGAARPTPPPLAAPPPPHASTVRSRDCATSTACLSVASAETQTDPPALVPARCTASVASQSAPLPAPPVSLYPPAVQKQSQSLAQRMRELSESIDSDDPDHDKVGELLFLAQTLVDTLLD